MRDTINVASLHVVSDLHLGGAQGAQIFGSTAELVWLIDRVASTAEPGLHALLINGDFIDFLAEESGQVHFDPAGAVGKVDSVWSHFAPVFEALTRLVHRADRLLVVNLGNHDLELALPWVRSHLTRRLANGDVAAEARLRWVTDGTGVRFDVHGVDVLCVHGNEVDSWNVADHEHLRRIGRDSQFGLPIEPWRPNAGTRMVIEVMNEIKRRYPFVDLLKPETEAVLPVLAALDNGVHRKLLDLAGIAGRRAWDIARMRAGFLDADVEATAAMAASGAPGDYRPRPVFPSMAVGRSGAALLASVETAWQKGMEPMALVRGAQAQQLGFWSATRDFVTGRRCSEVLRKALEHLDADRSFDPSAADEGFTQLDALVGADVDVLVAGHTHLERSIARSRGRGHYFNSGTWARLIRIAPEVRRDEKAFDTLFRILEGGSMATLDAATITVGAEVHPVVLRRNSVVIVEPDATDATRVRASLCRVVPVDAEGPIRLGQVPEAVAWTKG